jgi:hypothetical protein
VVAFKNIVRIPLPPPGLDSIAEVAAGTQHVALRTRSGQVVVWADPVILSNYSDKAMLTKLGDPATNVTSIASGSHSVIALTDRGEVLCSSVWAEGLPAEGLCSASLKNSNDGIVLAGSAGGKQTAQAIRAGANNVFFVQLTDASGTWVVFHNDGDDGDYEQGPVSSEMLGIKDIADLLVLSSQNRRNYVLATHKAGGQSMATAVSDSESLRLWVAAWVNGQSALSLDRYTGNVVAIASLGNGQELLVLKSGDVVTLRSGATSSVPDYIQGHVERVSAGYDHVVALLHNGSVVAWGDDAFGQVSRVPPEVSSGKALAISAGKYISVAIVDPLPLQPATPLPPPGVHWDEVVGSRAMHLQASMLHVVLHSDPGPCHTPLLNVSVKQQMCLHLLYALVLQTAIRELQLELHWRFK